MQRFRPTRVDVRTQEFRDFVRRPREVVLLAAITQFQRRSERGE